MGVRVGVRLGAPASVGRLGAAAKVGAAAKAPTHGRRVALQCARTARVAHRDSRGGGHDAGWGMPVAQRE